MDSPVSSRGEFRVELESLRRDVACFMQEMREVKTAPFKLRGFAADSSPDEEVGAASQGTEDLLPRARAVAADAQQIGSTTTVVQSQLSGDHVVREYPGNLLHDE